MFIEVKEKEIKKILSLSQNHSLYFLVMTFFFSKFWSNYIGVRNPSDFSNFSEFLGVNLFKLWPIEALYVIFWRSEIEHELGAILVRHEGRKKSAYYGLKVRIAISSIKCQ